jgi:probable blue pigment (indigoidine) exporter
MARTIDLAAAAIAPAIWGSTYLVTTELLPAGYPLSVAMLRALPAGLLLLLLTRQLPRGIWWGRALVLGVLNFSVFWWMLFVAAYRLPGGVAATVGAIQPLVVIVLARILLQSPIRPLSVAAGFAGVAGVALLILTPKAALDPLGIVAGLVAAVSMAIGTVLSRRWQPPVSALTFASWQLTAGGLLLLPAALLLEPSLPAPSWSNLLGFSYLGLIGAALTYILWFRGLARLEPAAISSLGLLSPVMAVILGWSVLGQQLSVVQMIGMAVVLASVWASQHAQRRAPWKVAGRAAHGPRVTAARLA